MIHTPFHYAGIQDLADELHTLNRELQPLADISGLQKPIQKGTFALPNRIAFQAMEGCDAQGDGTPSELTLRRYDRFARSGAGFIYVEATAVDPNGRANPRQMMLTAENVAAYRALADAIHNTALQSGFDRPWVAIQLTHSGRYSKNAQRQPAPIVAWPDPERDPKGITPTVITDEECDALIDRYVAAAALAKQAGFDCVDVKCCHGYLLNEFSGARLRPGRYGGSFENRTRLLLTIVRRIREEVGIPMMVRLSVHDEYPLPYGFGVDAEDFRKPDLTETKMLVDLLVENGVGLIDCTAGNPYYNPHVNRPFDAAAYVPPVSQLEQILKHWDSVRELKQHNDKPIYIASMFTWLRQYAPAMAAATINAGYFDLAGWGRQSFAYPSFPADILHNGGMDAAKCCLSCSKCTDLMRTGNVTGCVMRDKVYTDLYRSIPAEDRPKTSKDIREHI